MINDHYIMSDSMIGNGSYGRVYRGVDRRTDDMVAIKIDNDPFLLEREVKVYQYLWQYLEAGYTPNLHIPRLLWEGTHGGKRILVLERLGPSLDKLFDRYGKRWSRSTVYWILIQALRLIGDLHELGILHRDIKPDNFSIGYADRMTLYLFDFGLSSQYIGKSGKHVPERAGMSMIGTMRYASLTNHAGIQQSRRDDLESLVYMALYFWDGTLPWKHTADHMEDRVERSRCIAEQKREVGTVLHPSLQLFYDYVLQLKYDEIPDYPRWIKHFEDLYQAALTTPLASRATEFPSETTKTKSGIDWVFEECPDIIKEGKTRKKRSAK
jgi:serine/threonine protein kinase